MPATRDLVALLPAAGAATRLGDIPFSKCLYPCGSWVNFADRESPKLVGQFSLDQARTAGASRGVMVVHPERLDVLRHFQAGGAAGLPLTYACQTSLTGLPGAIVAASPILAGQDVLFNMPDTIMEPYDAMQQVVQTHRRLAPMVTLAVFPTQKSEQVGAVLLDGEYVIDSVEKRPNGFRFMWGAACWDASFTDFVVEWVARQPPTMQEWRLGDVFASALAAGHKIAGHVVRAGKYWDVGTFPELRQAVNYFGVAYGPRTQ